ncbi:MAG: hypothetical protein QM730_12775 [Anaerolineales bacterium]
MKNEICPKCGSNEIMKDLKIPDKGHLGAEFKLQVVVTEPEPVTAASLWMTDGASGQVRAWVCSQCGFTELYTDNLENLYKKYKQYQSVQR